MAKLRLKKCDVLSEGGSLEFCVPIEDRSIEPCVLTESRSVEPGVPAESGIAELGTLPKVALSNQAISDPYDWSNCGYDVLSSRSVHSKRSEFNILL